jgi:putative ABC transport system permease protein
VRSLLYGVQPFDPVTTASAVLLLMAIGIAGGTVPTARALRVEPASALRQD